MSQNIDLKVNLKSTESLLYSSLDSKIYLAVALISLIFLFYSIWSIKPIVVEGKDFLGLVSHLSLAYWIGYVLIILCSIRLYLDTGYKNDLLYILVLIIFGLFFFGVPIFAEENARFPWSYYPAGEIKAILGTKYIDTTSEYPLLSYRSWPAIHLISASVLYLANINIETLLKYMPLFWIFSVILITFSIGKRLRLSANQSFSLSLLLLSSLWIYDYYYGPQSFAYILYLLLFMLIVTFGKAGKIKDTLLVSLIFATIVITHILTSIAILTSFVISSLFIRSIHSRRIKFILFFLIIFIAWYIYLAPFMFEKGVTELINQMARPDILGFIKTDKYTVGESLTRQITHYSRLSYVVIYAIFMMAATTLYLTGKIKNENKGLVTICLSWLFGALALFALRYGENEIDDRIYMFSLIAMALIIILSFNRKILVILTILLILPHITAHYGTESYDMTRTTELRGAEFFAMNIPTDKDPYTPYSYFYSTYIRFYDPQKISMPWYSFTGSNRPNISTIDAATYIVNSNGSYNFMMYAHGFDPVQEWTQLNQNNINSFYDNGYFKIYKKR